MRNSIFNIIRNIASKIMNRKHKILIISAILLFLLLNTLKIALFNYHIIPVQTAETFRYKFEISLIVSFLFYQLVFKFKYRIGFIVFYILQVLYVTINLSYYLYFHSYLHFLQWMTLFGEGFKAAGHSAEPLNAKMLIVFIDLPVFVYLVFNYFKVVKVNFEVRVFRRILTVVSLVIMMFIINQNYAYGNYMIKGTSTRYKGESPIVQRYGTVVNEIVNIYTNRNEKELISQLKYGSQQANNTEKQNRPNFVLIQVESMDANIINKKYNGEYIMPFLQSLASKNVYYPYLMSYHKGGGTSDSEFSTINSVEPLDSFPAIKLSDYKYPNSMMWELAKSGYTTMAFHGNMGSFYNRDTAFPKMGFQEFFDTGKMNLRDIGWGAPDRDVYNFVANRISSTKGPFLSYIITMTSHGPFENAKNYYNNKRYDRINDKVTRNYFNSMSYVDRSIEEFVNKIKADCPNTYILIWGDHTPNVNSDIYKQASLTEGDRYLEFVPFIAVTPDHKAFIEDSKAVSFLDISPTVLEASGIRYDIKSDGLDLLNGNDISGTVPFKGAEYDRKYLYEIISKVK